MKIRDYEKWMNEDADFQPRRENKKIVSFKKMKRTELAEDVTKFPDKKRFKKR